MILTGLDACYLFIGITLIVITIGIVKPKFWEDGVFGFLFNDKSEVSRQ